MTSRPNTLLGSLRPRAIAKLARELYRQGHREEALATLRRAHAKRVNDLTLCRALAELLEHDGRPERAEVYYRHALRLAPTDIDLRLAHAEFLSRRGQVEAAANAAEAALELVHTVMVAALSWPGGWPLRVNDRARAALQQLVDARAPVAAVVPIGRARRRECEYGDTVTLDLPEAG